MGRFLPYTRYPVYRIPVHNETDCMGDLSFIKDSCLFDLEQDYAQEHPIEDEELEAAMCRKLAAGMKEAQAPLEQYERLGLSERGFTERLLEEMEKLEFGWRQETGE